MRFLPPETLAKLGRCELSARGVVEGFISGRHKSPFKGFSVEFAEHRQYTPGDDLRNLDWRVLARKDRYFIKQYIDETNMRVTLLLDASGSMAYAGDEAAPRDGRPLSKLAYAQYIAAMLGYLLVNQQDAAGLVTFDTALRSQKGLLVAEVERAAARLALGEKDEARRALASAHDRNPHLVRTRRLLLEVGE